MGTYVMHGSWAMCFMPVEVVYHTRKTSEVLEVIERKHLIFFFEDEPSVTQWMFSLVCYHG